MLRRVLQRTRLHLPAPIGHDNGAAQGLSSDDGDSAVNLSVAYTSLRDDESVRDHFRKRREDVSSVRFVVGTKKPKVKNNHVAERTLDEQRRAAEAWARLQKLYGLFRELEAATDEGGEERDSEHLEAQAKEKKWGTSQKGRRQSTRDEGLRSLLQELALPPGVILRDLQTLATVDSRDENTMPQGFTAEMFAALGNALYNEMIASAEQNRISPDTFEDLGNCLYADAVVSATA
ncbi:hypothetical protein PsorP6_016258 [Peronosclerospora sorghi]|uniref:Uncharacterized protein n=1 Tax=Peronosclerospora sorghi TaxID=230839 RepID=A0ACC0VIQ4_9STRA|nr:hypothetical protein PsorP6_016258 [Peronosclerospora sorghi]